MAPSSLDQGFLRFRQSDKGGFATGSGICGRRRQPPAKLGRRPAAQLGRAQPPRSSPFTPLGQPPPPAGQPPRTRQRHSSHSGREVWSRSGPDGPSGMAFAPGAAPTRPRKGALCGIAVAGAASGSASTRPPARSACTIWISGRADRRLRPWPVGCGPLGHGRGPWGHFHIMRRQRTDRVRREEKKRVRRLRMFRQIFRLGSRSRI